MIVLVASACGASSPTAAQAPLVPVENAATERTDAMIDFDDTGMESIVLGGGCFWCVEAAMEELPGVREALSGYAGGSRRNPSYEQVSTGLTGHAEVVRVSFDPALIGLDHILDLFFEIHDPTTEDRQGADRGTQYRSIILYRGEGQRKSAEAAIARAASRYRDPVVTELGELGDFWPAEEYHQDFFRKNPDYGYCQVVVAPKVRKAESFVDKLGK